MSDWCHAMEMGTELTLPWRMLRDKLVVMEEGTNKVKYMTTFEKIEGDEMIVSVSMFLALPHKLLHLVLNKNQTLFDREV